MILFAIPIFILLFGIFCNALRNIIISQLPIQLLPNRLLTRYPIILLEGSQSSFYRYNYFNCLAKITFEHGYQVFNFNFSKYENLTQYLKTNNAFFENAHLIGDTRTLQVFNDELAAPFKFSSELDISTLLENQTSAGVFLTFFYQVSIFYHQQILSLRKLVFRTQSGFLPPDFSVISSMHSINAQRYLDYLQKLAENDYLRD